MTRADDPNDPDAAAERTGLPDPHATIGVTGWLDAAHAGDTRALDALFATLRPRLLRSVAVRTGRSAAALDPEVEDIVQDAMLAAFGDFRTQEFSSSGALLRWLVTIAMNDVRDRARWRAVRADLEALRTAMASQLGDHAQRPPLEGVWADELERATDAALTELDADDRDVLLLRNYEGLSAAEIAAELGLRTEEAARARLLRARRRLARALAPFLDGGRREC